jgi:hypothetical protein
MSDKAKKRQGGSVGLVLYAAVVLYAVSLAPAEWWAKVSKTEIDELHSVYAPIFWLGRQSPVAQRIIGSYIRDWRGVPVRN